MSSASASAGRALVTGGTGGVGSAVVRRLAADGWSVVATSRTLERATESADAAEGDVHPLVLDLDEPSGCVDAVASAVGVLGGLDAVVHAAGPRVPQHHLSTVDPATMSAALEAEAGGFFRLVSASLQHLRSTSGSLVAVTSAATDRYPVRDGLSSGPKAAIEGIVKAIAAEEGRFGVRANAVGPGMMSDGMAANLIEDGHYDEAALEVARRNIAMRRFGSCDEVAAVVCFLSSRDASYVSGQIVNVDGGYSV